MTDVETLAEMADVVEQSSVTNTAITYPLWPWSDWKFFIEPRLKAVQGIRKFQYFRFDSDAPGIVFFRERRDTEEISVKLINNNAVDFAHNERPSVLSPAGLSESRRRYLTISP
ncbi:hypothetical protein DPMN_108180 [Dreissena polymorpha]|uniref:Uncharacterized protein n=1 Tax=Dreissena polymorpha TaxID=45954 RepID=A0A9D4K818_DREPO|nr:hypothetical protein DPMN_108180 [Dreissena polymorpha]